MSYQVLARKWRPRFFGEMVGQAHVLQALINALDQDRLHHAYLFTGTRGVGKTTVARILAKSLNCEEGVSAEPCGKCSACTEINEGRFIDLIEVDAASRTKVEDTRELLDNVQYAPTRGRYKVYLIDEVHMLSTHSFNALLKTLEEPPPHVKFLLATTNPKKLPATILSRCLQFHLKRLPVDLIVPHLAHILSEESISAQAEALALLARAADGSMRDALSLLDQAIAFGGGKITEADARSMLGVIEERHAVELLNCLASGDAAGILQKVAQLSEHVSDFEPVLEDLLSLLQRIAIAQLVEGSDVASDKLQGDIVALADSLTPEDVQLYYQICLTGRRDLPLSPSSRDGFEMILLRMFAFRPVDQASAVRKPDMLEKPAKVVAAKVPESKPTPESRSVEAAEQGWKGIIESIELKGMVRELAANCIFVRKDDDVLELLLDPSHEHLVNGKLEKRLEAALRDHYKTPLRLMISCAELPAETPAQADSRREKEIQAEAVQSIQEDSNVKALQEVFNAKVEAGSVEPLT